MMTKGSYQELVAQFYQQNKPFQDGGHVRVQVIDAKDGGKQCQLCGNKHLKYLCKIHNEKGEEWLIGRECHTALDELQEQDFKIAMNERITCSKCGKEQRRGELPKEAYSEHLCRACWSQVKLGIPIVF